MTTWQRVGECPATVKKTFTVNRDEFPELARWLWEMPHRDSSKNIRDTLAAALGEQPTTRQPRPATVPDARKQPTARATSATPETEINPAEMSREDAALLLDQF